MTGSIRQYLTALIAVSFLSAVIQWLFGEKGGGAVRFCCGMLTVIVALSPLKKLDFDDISRAFSRLRINELQMQSGIEAENKAIAGDIIKEKTEAYIWDKAAQFHFEPQTVSVTVCLTEELPYPTGVEIVGKFTQQQRNELTLWIEQNLAIEKTHQTWMWK